MMRSMFSAISGLRAHQTWMDVIGNNIANVNTTGFKVGRVRFTDILSQLVRGASGPTETRGGINPLQIGLGAVVGAVDTIHTQGALQLTGKPSDLAIQGDGFFVVSDGSQTLYTRTRPGRWGRSPSRSASSWMRFRRRRSPYRGIWMRRRTGRRRIDRTS
jgi:flagellar hook protein FlgE